MGVASGQVVGFMPLSVRSRPNLPTVSQTCHVAPNEQSRPLIAVLPVSASGQLQLTFPEEDALADLANHGVFFAM